VRNWGSSLTNRRLNLLVLVALVGGALASHTGHELLYGVGDLVHVSGVDRVFFTVLGVALDIQLILVFLVLEITVLLNLLEAIGLRISLG
jgi:hypothetical protein